MGVAAVTARLREVGRLHAAAGPGGPRALDMSSAAVTVRLRTLGGLSDMCRRLGAVGMALRPLSARKGHVRGADE